VAAIEVVALDQDQVKFRVTVREEDSKTEHTVRVSSETLQSLTGGAISSADLVARSFEFLLGREPKESILREFDLSVIERYFPDFQEEIRQGLRGRGGD
jgi:hypothetical protein